MVSTETQANHEDESLRAIVAELERRVRTLETENEELKNELYTEGQSELKRINSVAVSAMRKSKDLEKKVNTLAEPGVSLTDNLDVTPIERHLAGVEEIRRPNNRTTRAIYIAQWMRDRQYATKVHVGMSLRSNNMVMRRHIEAIDKQEGRLAEDSEMTHLLIKRALDELADLFGDKVERKVVQKGHTKTVNLIFERDVWDSLILSPDDYEDAVNSL